MAIVRWQPGGTLGSEVDKLRQEVDQLFNSYASGGEPFFSRVYPAINITEDNDNFYVRAELPGVKPESMDISVVEGRLLIRGERKIGTEDEKTNYHRRERESGFFRRTVALPARVSGDKVFAAMKNGILTITLPKAEESKPRKVTVKTG